MKKLPPSNKFCYAPSPLVISWEDSDPFSLTIPCFPALSWIYLFCDLQRWICGRQLRTLNTLTISDDALFVNWSMGRNIKKKKKTNGEVKGTDTTVKESWITRVCGESKHFFFLYRWRKRNHHGFLSKAFWQLYTVHKSKMLAWIKYYNYHLPKQNNEHSTWQVDCAMLVQAMPYRGYRRNYQWKSFLFKKLLPPGIACSSRNIPAEKIIVDGSQNFDVDLSRFFFFFLIKLFR